MAENNKVLLQIQGRNFFDRNDLSAAIETRQPKFAPITRSKTKGTKEHQRKVRKENGVSLSSAIDISFDKSSSSDPV